MKALLLACALALASATVPLAEDLCENVGTNHFFLPHHECNKFYTCSQSNLIVLTCPPTLLYNTVDEVCDYPKVVDCGKRLIPEDENSKGEGDNGHGHDSRVDSSEEDSGDSKDDGGNSGNSEDSSSGDSNESSNNEHGSGNNNPSEAPAICAAENSDGVLVANENCNQFYKCSNGVPVALNCPGNLVFNPDKDVCDWPKNVDCGDRVIPEGGNGGDDSSNGDNDGNSDGHGNSNENSNGSGDGNSDGHGNSNENNNGAGNSDPSEAPAICAADNSDGVLVANENCNQFYKCSNGVPVALNCPGNLVFNPDKDVCDWPKNVDCGDRVIPEGGNGGDDNSNGDNDGNSDGHGNSNENSNGSDDGNSDGHGNSNENNNGAGNSDPSEAPAICAAEDSDGVLVANENCNQFYKCSNGVPVALNCPGNLVFNPDKDVCDWPKNVDCGDRVIPEGGNGGDDNSNGDNDGNSDGLDDSNENSNDADDGNNDGHGNSNENNNGAGNSDPSEAPAICAAENSDGVLVANENCNQFYKCSNGVPVALNCPGNLVFNPDKDVCDWPKNVDCGDRVIPEGGNGGDDNSNGDNDGNSDGLDDSNENSNGAGDGNNDGHGNSNENNNGAGNSDPSEAPAICAAENSDGVLVANENCNQFYKCSNGVPVALNCPGNLVFNPDKDVCDWPKNVDCGDRVIPEGGNGGDDNSNGDNDGNSDGHGNSNENSNGADDGNSDGHGNSNENNNGAGNSDPSEAPAICAAENSDGVLVANENCNQFYKCSNGVPVALNCPGNLVFNPDKDVCDWPKNVDCGDRVIPEGGNGGEDNSNGDNDGNSDGNGNSNENSNGADDGNSDGHGNSNENNNGAGNSDPSEAPAICAAEDSDGVLVANENCNQFYKCSNGVPVALNCPGNLVFNPDKDVCDWPKNVDCGDRVIPEGGNGGDDNSNGDNDGNSDGHGNSNENSNGSDDGNSDGHGNSNENNNGAGNSDPSEAPAICAAEDSDGVLVANENCNQFYKCSNGVPVALNCPGNLVFNPDKDVCDWPKNVDCGDRVIPEGGNGGDDNSNGDNDGNSDGHDDSNEDSNGAGDGNSDGHGNSNENNNGAGNSDPSEAPAICAAENSDGVLVANENCNQFYKCSNGVPVALNCPGNLVFNPDKDVCDWPKNVDCGDRVIPEGGNGGDDNSNGDNDGNSDGHGNSNENSNGSDDGNSDGHGNSNENNNGAGNSDPSEAPAICAAEDSDGVLVANENCNQFYKCSNGVPVALNCPGNLVFNPDKDVCDWPKNVDCGDRVIPEGGNGGDDNSNGDNDDNSDGHGNSNENSNGADDGNNDGHGNSNENNNGAGNSDPSEAPAICAAENSDGVLVANENCNQFYKCSNGVPVALNCPGNLVFNPDKDACDWPKNVDCGDRVISEGGNGGDDNSNGDDDSSSDEHDDSNEDSNGAGDNNSDGHGNSNGNNNGAGNSDPSEAPAICASENSDGVLVANENCNQFYKCSNGVPVALNCPGNLVFNPDKDACDWPKNVDCGDRVIPEGGNGGDDNSNGDDDSSSDEHDDSNEDSNGSGDNNSDGHGNSNGNNNGAGNSDPSEAPAICAAEKSNGVLVAHENCNQFYKCSNGVPVALNCPGNLVFNPDKDACDWPKNVDCGDRVIPEGGNGGDDNSNGDDDSSSDEHDDSNEDSNGAGDDNSDGHSNSNGNNNGAGNSDPSEAPAICAAEKSNGVLVAHENCNQFYKCSNGVPVALNCPGNLVFNPAKDVCDWLKNVDCGDRVVPKANDKNSKANYRMVGSKLNAEPSEASAICAKVDSDGVLVAHENCNQFYICSRGIPVPSYCQDTLLYNPEMQWCDWPENVDCGNRGISEGGNAGGDNDNDDGNNNGGGNSNPSEAPAICAKEGSNGVLVAHENCNQFYVCSGGIPVPSYCQDTLLYRPEMQWCDWPENVDCGNRGISEGGNAGGDNDNDGGNNNGGGNSNPSEAPVICAKEGSNGVLVAHENCDQFYLCSEGLPVAIDCQPPLLYNPANEWCDWSDNVDCGDRITRVFFSRNKHLRNRHKLQFQRY